MSIASANETRFPLDQLLDAFRASGGTDDSYLRGHYLRFCRTKDLVERSPNHPAGTVLDVGAHWLHQASLYALDGYRVLASDFPATLDLAPVKAFADAHHIGLVPYQNLESGDVFAAIPDGSIDLLLFTEIIEHITFNPLRMWRELYRVLKVGGRIVITTPNYYRIDGRVWNPGRSLRQMGGGITVDEILRTNTYGHHWKEYSLNELIYYFALLSPDFVPHKAHRVRNYYPNRPRLPAPLRFLESSVPFFRPNLHVEVALSSKAHGITVASSW
jgi:2-polyprenyl-6-hydroxyphenyl methylase/3-demethylubiquinone-9 3-methyltransferase